MFTSDERVEWTTPTTEGRQGEGGEGGRAV